nr:unnamed protein product [Callosobruchus chinensis]
MQMWSNLLWPAVPGYAIDHTTAPFDVHCQNVAGMQMLS